MTGAILLAVAILAVGWWTVRDYRAWRALGPGGLPSTWAGWWRMTRFRLIARDPLSLAPLRAAAGGAGDVATLDDLPRRAGTRPRVAPHPIPHRQLTDEAPAAMKALLQETFAARVAADGDRLMWHRSYFEKNNDAVTLTPAVCGCVDHGEVGHIHPSDGSMHMIVSPTDAATVIEQGWGERHGLAGIAAGLPLTYMLIYAPLGVGDVVVTDRILAAAVTYRAGLLKHHALT